MATIAEIQKEIYDKIELLPLEALRETDGILKKKISYITKKTASEKSISLAIKKHSPKDSFYIQSLFGIKIDTIFLSQAFIQNLFKNADFEFYLNEMETHLFSQNNELLSHDFGVLKPISALQAWTKYGLEPLENAKEKVYIKLNSNAQA